MTDRYKYIEEGDFEPAFGVSASINEKRAEYEPTYTKYLSVGIVLLVLSPLPLIISAVTGGSDAVILMMTALLLCIVALGVYMIVRVSMTKTCYETLTKGSGYEKTRKSGEKLLKAFSGEYWSIALAVYLSWSFISKDWGTTWIVWPIAAVAFIPLTKLAELITGKDEDDSEDDE